MTKTRKIPCAIVTQGSGDAERELRESLRVARKQLQMVERLVWLQWLALIALVPTCIVLLSRI